MFRPSARSSEPTMPSADFCQPIPTPLDVSSPKHIGRPPRVRLNHLYAYTRCIYFHTFRASIGLWVYLPLHPVWLPLMQFLFVGPALCLRLPSDSTLR